MNRRHFLYGGLPVVALGLTCLPDLFGDEPRANKTGIRVAADGYPTGQDSPEGAACDVVRALIRRDEKLFSATCIRLYAGGVGPKSYAEFLHQVIQSMREEAARKEPSPRGPKSIAEVFAARHLSHHGPASFGYAAFDFQDIMFVDVFVTLYDGEHSMMRTLVIQDGDGKWYVHPAPQTSPLLSEGLNEEAPSTVKLTDAHVLAPK